MTLPKRTIDEWLTVARVNGSTKIVFAEGATDARLLTAASGYSPHADFRSADEIELDNPPATLFSSGNRARICALAAAADIASREEKFRCLVDGDFSCFVSQISPPVSLVTTDYANLVVGCITFEWLRNFYARGYGLFITDADWKFTESALKFCFAARYISAFRNLGRGAPSPSDFIVKNKGVLGFDEIRYLRKYFEVNISSANVYKSDVLDVLSMRKYEIRYQMHSSDLFDFVYGVLRKTGKIGGGVSKDSVKSAILAALPADLGSQPAVNGLIAWARAA